MFRPSVILWVTVLATLVGFGRQQGHTRQKAPTKQPKAAAGKETFLSYCASCHGRDAKGNGPAAIALKSTPPDLTTLSRRHEGKFPRGYVSALLTFGRSLASHGSEEMPIWGVRFATLDPEHDPTGRQHIADLVAYIQSLQAK